MRKIVIALLWLLVILFPPYWDSGIFDDDIGWIFLFDDYSYFTPVLSSDFFFGDFSWSIFFFEVIALIVLNAVWKKGEVEPAPLAAQTFAAPVAAQPKTDVATELGKLNELRMAGALSEEEFAQQKAKLLGGEAGQNNRAASAATPAGSSQPSLQAGVSGRYPTARIEAAVEAGRAGGIRDFQNVPPLHKLLWRLDLPVPPTSYLDANQRMFGAFVAAAALVFGLLMTLFAHLVFDEASFGSFAFLTLAFGGVMFITVPFQARKLRRKHNLPEWDDLPGAD